MHPGPGPGIPRWLCAGHDPVTAKTNKTIVARRKFFIREAAPLIFLIFKGGFLAFAKAESDIRLQEYVDFGESLKG